MTERAEPAPKNTERLFRDGADDRPNVVNMPAGENFLPLLARGLRGALGARLQDALILLPTRRAVRELGEAFVQTAFEGAGAARASLLPMMRPLADIEPDEPPFEPGELAHKITPAIDPVRRRFALAGLVLAKEAKLRDLAPDAASALALSDPLLACLDDVAMEELDVSRLDRLDEIIALSAQHYQQSAIFYKIVQTYWPQYLKEHGRMDPMQRRVALLRALTTLWQEHPPQHPVIIAGSTGTLAATAELMRVVARLPQGLIVLPGLDTHMRKQEIWDAIGPTHPQASLRRLIKTIGIEREAIGAFPGAKTSGPAAARRRLIAEALIPADATAGWLERIDTAAALDPADNPFTVGAQGLALIETQTADEEAAVIALALRETLEQPGRTAALITPDPALGRRVRARLSRWGVEVDVSAGEPLEETGAGAFMTHIAALAIDPWNPLALAAVMKHSLTALGTKPAQVRAAWERLEHKAFRGPAPKNENALMARLMGHAAKTVNEEDAAAARLLKALHGAIAPLTQALPRALGPQELARLHCEAAEALAMSDTEPGAARLWRGEDGEAVSRLMGDMLAHGELLPRVDGQGYARLLAQLMRGRVVRPKFGTHPRLQILGPLEARMIFADRIILGGLNEGLWPAPPATDPLLSYTMRSALGLSSPEQRIGLAAHDFAQLAAHSDVMMTRARRGDDGPMVASRWLWRLKALIKGALVKENEQMFSSEEAAEAAVLARLAPSIDYLALARALDFVPAQDTTPLCDPPSPKPSLAHRQNALRRLSVTRIETWYRDPYAIYARYILGLRKLEPLGAPLGPREYGNAVHRALEDFAKAYPKTIPDKASTHFSAKLDAELRSEGYKDADLALERRRASAMGEWLTTAERARRQDQGLYPIALEIKGLMEISVPSGPPFLLSAEADRIDKGPDGYEVLDYKTGKAPAKKQVGAGFSPQLPLEAAMVQNGAFPGVPAGPVVGLNYVQINGRGNEAGVYISPLDKEDAATLAATALEGLGLMIARYDDPEQAFLSQPRAQWMNPYGDYDHLARRAEWAQAQEGGEESGQESGQVSGRGGHR